MNPKDKDKKTKYAKLQDVQKSVSERASLTGKNENILDFVNPFSASTDKKGTKDFRGIPIPLPVDVIHANENTPNFPLPLPIKNDGMSRESTQAQVLETLKTLDNELNEENRILKSFIKLLPESLQKKIKEDNENIFNKEEKIWDGYNEENKSAFSKIVYSVSGAIKSIFKPFTNLFTTVEKWIKKQSVIEDIGLKLQIEAIKQREEEIALLSKLKDFALFDSKQSSTNDLRQLAKDAADNKEREIRDYSGFDKMEYFDKSKAQKFLDGTARVASFWAAIGTVVGNVAFRTVLGMLGGAGATGIVASVGSIVTFLAGFGGLVTAVGAIVIGSPFVALMNHPEQIGAYMGAFSALWTDAIMPTLKFLSEEVVPPLTVLFGGLLAGLFILMDTLGTGMNFTIVTLIYSLAATTKLVIGLLTNFVDGTKDVLDHVLGIFGIGKYGEDGVLNNILGVFTSIGNMMYDIVDTFINNLNLRELLGMEDGEGIKDRIVRFITGDIPNVVINLVDKIVAYISELNPFDIMAKKLEEMVTGIINLIPSWEDLKGWMRNIIPDWLGADARNWLLQTLGLNAVEPQKTISPEQKNILDQIEKSDYTPVPKKVDAYKQFYQSMADSKSPTIVISPNTTNNNTNSVVRNGGGVRGGGTASTQPELSGWDRFLHGVGN